MKDEIRFMEELSMNAHPSIQTKLYDGWVLGFSNGYTSRANCVNLLYPSTKDLMTKIAYCEECYDAVHQPCIFKVTDDNELIDSLLEERGYQVAKAVSIMSMDLRGKEFKGGECMISQCVTEEWLQGFFRMEGYCDKSTQEIAHQMFELIQNPTYYCSINEDDHTVACASVVVECGYMFLGNVIVDEQYRGRGYARRLCEALMAEAVKLGAHTAYLQVMKKNEPAISLYRSLGFKPLYSYWYRIKQK